MSIRSVCSGHAAGVLLFPGTSKSLSSLHASSHNSKAARRVSTLQSPIAATAMASVSPLTRPPLLPPLLSPRLSLLLHGDRTDNFLAPEVIIISNIVISEAASVYVEAIAAVSVIREVAGSFTGGCGCASESAGPSHCAGSA